jgi:hypothetical protein
MGAARVIFRKTPRPAVAVSKWMPTAPVVFLKALDPPPALLEDPWRGHDFDKPATSRMVDALCKAAADAGGSVMSFADEQRARAARERVARAIDSWGRRRPLDADLIDAVLAGS